MNNLICPTSFLNKICKLKTLINGGMQKFALQKKHPPFLVDLTTDKGHINPYPLLQRQTVERAH